MWRRNLYRITKKISFPRNNHVKSNNIKHVMQRNGNCNTYPTNSHSRYNFSSMLSQNSASTSTNVGMNRSILLATMIGGITGVTLLTNTYDKNSNNNVFAESDTSEKTTEVDKNNKEEEASAAVIPEDRPRTVVSIYLNNETKRKLKEQFPTLFSNERYDHLTIYFNPSDGELKPVYKLLGNEFSMQPLAHVSNESSQVLYCKIVKNEDGSRNIQSSNKYPHVTLSFSDSTNANASNLLLQRADARGVLKVAAGSSTFKWNGVLPVWKDEKGKLHSATRVNVESVKSKMNYLLDGTLCTDRHWKKIEQQAVEDDGDEAAVVMEEDKEDTYYCDKPTCGFCEFMKGGPCREVFINWENCVDKCNDVSSDFVDECSDQTIKLKECIDSNQEYYGILNQPPPGEEVEGKEKVGDGDVNEEKASE